ncbi:MAG: DHHA1 domain-containing protein, partial [Oscillospiraceae bacterium]
ILTDTGCFKYSNTSSNTHIIAAHMIDAGASHAKINNELFDTKSKARLELEKEVISGLEYYFDNRCAVIHISNYLLEKTGASDEEIEGLSAIPRQIEGVEVGITLREKENGYKISMRTTAYVSACEICKSLGGGGHARAAGCFIEGNLEEVTKKIVSEVGKYF